MPPLFRLLIKSTASNGLRSALRLMVDKVTTVAKSKPGEGVGRLDDADLLWRYQALLVFLGLAASSKSISGSEAKMRERK